MSCCAGDIAEELGSQDYRETSRREEYLHSGHELKSGNTKYVFSVANVHCGACINIIEKQLKKQTGINSARVNLTLKQLDLEIDQNADILQIVDQLEKLGYPPTPVDLGDLSEFKQEQQSAKLIRALAVAGFAAANIMLLSVSVWSGADGETRKLFELVSALIAIPAISYSGQVFFRSAFSALRFGHLNMDVPISLAIILSLFMSLYETFYGSGEAYFDAGVMLLFFLLIGRYLDQKMREKARNSVFALSKIAAKGANRILPDGQLTYIPIDQVKPGMTMRIFPGDRTPVDGVMVSGQTDLDRALVNGESDTHAPKIGEEIEAGVLNLTGAIDIKASKPADQSFLSEVSKMLEAAENSRMTYVSLADRMAKIYAPVVHIFALVAFLIWFFLVGETWYTSLNIAISVLIITCPCALGLAVPVTNVIAANQLFKNGILMRDGTALERAAEIIRIAFDKTGTLTFGTPKLAENEIENLGVKTKSYLKALTSSSSHPASKAIANALHNVVRADVSDIREFAGFGVQGVVDGKVIRLGRASWVSEIASGETKPSEDEISYAIEGNPLAQFSLHETLRTDALKAQHYFDAHNIEAEILSGDGQQAVAKIADHLGIEKWQAGLKPADKHAHLQNLESKEIPTMMVGDGLNDAPSLAAAHVSMAPASACEVGRQAADFIFTNDSLKSVPYTISTAQKAKRIIKQNFGIAIAYNTIAIPLAFLGFITPLIAAIAMSASSIIVVLNSLRLSLHDMKEVETEVSK
ncbi:MAG: heavy metal translocating P-type ATPase [Lentilitoribacter sp.]